MKQRLSALLLTLSCLLPLMLTSCGDSGPAVYRCGNITVTEGMYSYLYSCYKYMYRVNVFTETGKSFPDTAEGWGQRVSDGSDETHADAFHAYLEYQLKTRLVAAYLYENSGKTQSSSVTQALLRDVIDTTFLWTDADTKEERSALLSAYGADYDDMLRALLYEYEYDLLYEGLFGQSGNGVLADPAFSDDVKAFYDAYYIRIRYIAVDADDVNGKEKKEAAASALTDESFDAVLATYAKDTPSDMLYYAYDRYATSDNPLHTEAMLRAIAETDIGENGSAVIDGTTYLFRRYQTNREYTDEKYEELLPNFAGRASRYAYNNYLDSFYEKIEILQTIVYNPWDRKTCIEENAIERYSLS